ncbi:MAG: NUDIX domain-containing protein [Chloroflexota bacterium]|jgi:8-oxo-dGTP pyrophosphatase MutT (NUDIX family)
MQYLLRLIYLVARTGRDWYWALKQPHLYGVRTVVVAPDTSVLLVRHRAGPYAWVLPGGGVGRNEEIAHAAAREIMEEAGIELNPRDFTYHGRFNHHHNEHPNTVDVMVVHLADPLDPAPPRHSIEIADARFVTLRDIRHLDDAVEPGCVRRIEEVIQKRSPRVPKW